ncbi:MAG: hypothetical protein IKB05_00590 [Alphaproteobacteria bacterium]|nr:hypothetical protein [Alphaproteobacteria bacterium]
MKTKIIYISGNEVFEMAQIRAAFEEVRGALGLGADTVLFGVPVDADDALTNVATNTTQVITETQITQTIEEPTPEIIDTVEPETDAVQEPESIPEIIPEETVVEPVVEEAPEITAEAESDKIIPILSILSANDKADTSVDEPEVAPAMDATAPISEPEPDVAESIDALTVSIDDVVTDDAPVVEHEKTLEELLESMTPLGEDIISDVEPDTNATPEEEISDANNDDFSVSMTDDMADTDATLAQLANEFAQTQDKIPESPKPSGNGKIGKLKNILPFKKAKRDDNGLMGDLFGWAGIAANDEDFSIPGFFTGVAGQK